MIEIHTAAIMRNATFETVQNVTDELSAFLQTCYGFLVPLIFSGLAAMLRYHNPTRHRVLVGVATFVGRRWYSSQQQRESPEPSKRTDRVDTTGDPSSKTYDRPLSETNWFPSLLRDKNSESGIWSLVKMLLLSAVDAAGKVKDGRRCDANTDTGNTLDAKLEDAHALSPTEPIESHDRIPVICQPLVLQGPRIGLVEHKQSPQERKTGKEFRRAQLTTTQIVEELRPVRPLVLSRPQEAVLAAREFVGATNIRTMYAVKANDDPLLLITLWDTGIRWFEAASIFEIRHVMQSLPSPQSPTLCFMNPVKPEEDIRAAYFECNVRVFALHSEKELDKIIRATTSNGKKAQDLDLFVRLNVNSQHASLDLNHKFGIEGNLAIPLLQRLQREARKFGVCFHIGSQITDAADFRTAMQEVNVLEKQAGVQASKWSVGGGFGVSHPHSAAPTISECLETVEKTRKELFKDREIEMYCEPSRALAAKSESLVARVEERRGMELYINTGAYDMLSDAARLKWCYTVKLQRQIPSNAELREFSLWGPTGDCLDYLPGPFLIPEDVKEGDYIEIMDTGAYGRVLVSRANGLGEYAQVVIADPAPRDGE